MIIPFNARFTFQSTPSTRRETRYDSAVYKQKLISIHSLHTEGDNFSPMSNIEFSISIHSLHTEGDSD